MSIQLTRQDTNTSVYINFDNVKFFEPRVVEGNESTLITFIDGSTMSVAELSNDIAAQETAFATLRGGSVSNMQAVQRALSRPARRGTS